MKKVLTLPVNKHFFNQVVDEILEEDYREIKEYWINKLVKKKYRKQEPREIVKKYRESKDIFEQYTDVIFKNGYNDNSPMKEVLFEGIRLTNSDEMTCMGRGIAFAIKISYKSTKG